MIGSSPTKMRFWLKTFKEEGWVPRDFLMSQNSLELMYMYLKPGFRKKGYGTELFARTMSFVKSKKADEVYAYIGDRSKEGLDFYKDMHAEIISDFSDSEAASALLRWKI